MKSKITLKELAKLLNVSVSTVSKALNDSPEISPKTAERVKELAKKKEVYIVNSINTYRIEGQKTMLVIQI